MCCSTCDTAEPTSFRCAADFGKGQEMGWFQHGSTIIVFAPEGMEFADGVLEGQRVKMGQPVFEAAVG